MEKDVQAVAVQHILKERFRECPYASLYMRSKQEYSIWIDLTSIFRSFSESLLRYPGKMS